MKKLTKTLSLVLVIAMIVSLCVVGVSAKTFSKDGDKISENYKEAVDVMSGIGIIEGIDKEGTTFNPTGNFTRAAAAKIIAYMQLGVSAAESLKATSGLFKDVSASNWAAPYISYCAQKGIINGYGNGNFGPNDPLTGYAWAKMLLCSVGYGVKGEYAGANWSINVAKDALTKGVFTDVLSASTNDVITREQATQMAFNTLTGINTVTYSTLLGDYIDNSTTINGVSTGNKKLGETIYKLHPAPGQDNGYGVDGHIWYTGNSLKADKSNVVSGWYQDDSVVAEYTDLAALTTGDLYKLGIKAGSIKTLLINDQDADAALLKTVNDNIAGVRGGTDKPLANYAGAKLVILDTDTSDTVVADKAVVVIDYLAKVTKVQPATTTKEASISVTVYNPKGDQNVVIPTEKYDVTGIAQNDYVLIVPSNNNTTGFVAPTSITKATPVTSAVTTYVGGTSVTCGDKTYKFASNMNLGVKTGFAFTPATYDFYMDANGFVVGNVPHDTTSTLNYVYVNSTQGVNSTNLINGGSAAKASVTYMDGTTAVVDLEVKTAATTLTGANKVTVAPTQKYIVVKNASGDANYVVLPDTANKLVDSGLYSYTKNDAGALTLSQQVVVTVGTVPYTGVLKGTAADAITVKTGSSAVTGITGYFATAATKLVTVAADGTATTVTGVANFPNGTGSGMTFTVVSGTPAAAGQCSAIVYLTKGVYVTDILVVGNYKASATTSAFLTYMGTTYVGPNASGTSTTFYNFYGTDGKVVAYPVSAPVTPSKAGEVYAASVTDGVATLTAIASADLSASNMDKAAGVTVTDVNAAMLVTGTGSTAKAFNVTSSMVVLDVSDTNPANWSTGATILAKDTVTVVYSTATATAGNAVYVFITAHA